VALQYTFTVDPLPRVAVTYDDVNRTYQTAGILWYPRPGHPDSDSGDANLRVYAPGTFDPSQVMAHGAKVPVAGHDAYFDTTPRNDQHDPLPMLAWRYSADSWATLQFNPTQVSIAELRKRAISVAAKVHPSAPFTLRLPFRIGYLPGRVVPESAISTPSRPDVGAEIGLSDGVPASSSLPLLAGLRVELVVHPANYDCAKGTARVPGLGTKGCFQSRSGESGQPGRELRFVTRNWAVLITIDQAHRAVYSDNDLIKIARSLTLAPSLTDYKTWFDARAVLPH
jgi:hypothetical protein